MPDFLKQFKASIRDLKRKANDSLDQILSLDPKSKQDLLMAAHLSDKLTKALTDFNHKNFGSIKKEMQETLSLTDLNPSVFIKNVSNQAFGTIIGSNTTFLAVKNKTSFMLATWKKGLRVVEDGSEVYSENLPSLYGSLRDLVFIEPENCYLMAHDHKLWRKDIDSKPPYVVMEMTCGFRKGASFRYSEPNNRLFVIQNGNAISVVNLEKKLIEIRKDLSPKDMIMDFRLLGE